MEDLYFSETLDKIFPISCTDKDGKEWATNKAVGLKIRCNYKGTKKPSYTFNYESDEVVMKIPFDSVTKLYYALKLCGLNELALDINYLR